jgi:hypothetical protein
MDYAILLLGFYFGYAIRHLSGLWNMTYHLDEMVADEKQIQERMERLSHMTAHRIQYVIPFMLLLSALLWPLKVVLAPFAKMIKKKLFK